LDSAIRKFGFQAFYKRTYKWRPVEEDHVVINAHVFGTICTYSPLSSPASVLDPSHAVKVKLSLLSKGQYYAVTSCHQLDSFYSTNCEDFMNGKMRVMYVYRSSFEGQLRTLWDFNTLIQSTWHWTLQFGTSLPG
jgi:hypothetical protein